MAIWHFQDLGQFCACTSYCGHTLSSAQDHKSGYLDRPPGGGVEYGHGKYILAAY